MSIGSPDAKRVYSCTTRCAPSLPGSQVGIDIKRAVGKIYFGVGAMKVQRRRNHTMLEGEGGLDQPSNPCCCIQMTKIGFEGTDGTRRHRGGACTPDRGKPCPYGPL